MANQENGKITKIEENQKAETTNPESTGVECVPEATEPKKGWWRNLPTWGKVAFGAIGTAAVGGIVFLAKSFFGKDDEDDEEEAEPTENDEE